METFYRNMYKNLPMQVKLLLTTCTKQAFRQHPKIGHWRPKKNSGKRVLSYSLKCDMWPCLTSILLHSFVLWHISCAQLTGQISPVCLYMYNDLLQWLKWEGKKTLTVWKTFHWCVLVLYGHWIYHKQELVTIFQQKKK